MPSRSSILAFLIVAATSTSISDGFTTTNTIPQHSTTSSSSSSLSSSQRLAFSTRSTKAFSHVILSMKSSETDDWLYNSDDNKNLPSDNNENSGSFFGRKRRRRNDQEDDNNRRRQTRVKLEQKAKSRFVVGDELHMLRKQVLQYREELSIERSVSPTSRRVRELEHAMIQAQGMDAEYVYSISLERIKDAERQGKHDLADELRQEADMARSVLPHFNLDGLWVGKYGEHGYEMINVTYVEDTLVAYKVTGDKNVPKGQISFQVDLNPNPKYANVHGNSEEETNVLQPIELTDDATKQWGTKHLERFAGKGQVAAEGFTNNQWVDGQLIMVGEYFSFAWVPLGHQVFFGRQSAELTLKMFKQSLSEEEKTKQFLMSCMDETNMLQEDSEMTSHPDSGIFIDHYNNENYSQDNDDYYCEEGCFE